MSGMPSPQMFGWFVSEGVRAGLMTDEERREHFEARPGDPYPVFEEEKIAEFVAAWLWADELRASLAAVSSAENKEGG